MKYFIIFIMMLAYSSAVLCVGPITPSTPLTPTATTPPAVSATAAETALNQKLLENGAASQKLIDPTAPPTSISILSNKGSSSSTSTTNLTDQDKQLSENYVDQGAANRIIQEKCVGEMAQACAGSEVDHKTMGMSPAIMKAVAQAYATFGAMGDGFLPLSKPKAAEAPKDGAPKTEGADKPDTSKEKPSDYCKYIPTATETIASFSQKNTVEALNNGEETSQKNALLKAAKSHDGRADQAQMQAIGWYGGAGCYAAGAAMGKYAMDTSLIVKIGAATLLGTFYQAEVAANKEYAEKTRAIANSLPSKGDCNPVTQNDCYCSEPENANNPTYCKAQIASRLAGTAFTRVACTNSSLQIDPSCACEKTNTCFEKFLENQGAAELNIGIGYGNSPFRSLASLAHGKLEGGTLSSQAYAGTSAIAKKALLELSSKLQGNNNPLSPNQKAVADAIASKGIPSNIARLMAQNPPSQSAIDKSMSKFGGNGSYQLASLSPGRNNVLDFQGSGLGMGGKSKKSTGDDFLVKTSSKAGVSNAKILEFAQKAQEQAPQITKSDKLIFEIISIRYQTSGRRLLQLDSKN